MKITDKAPTARAAGYQSALDDVLVAYEEDGVTGALRWIEDNAHDEETRARARAFGRAAKTATR